MVDVNAAVSLLAAEQQSAGGSLIIFLPIMALLVYMMIVPQRKQKKKQEEMLRALTVGDDVVTSGGIHGTVTFLEDNVAHVLVDTDVVIRVTKTALTRLTPAADDEPTIDVTDATEVPDHAEKSAKKASKK